MKKDEMREGLADGLEMMAGLIAATLLVFIVTAAGIACFLAFGPILGVMAILSGCGVLWGLSKLLRRGGCAIRRG